MLKKSNQQMYLPITLSLQKAHQILVGDLIEINEILVIQQIMEQGQQYVTTKGKKAPNSQSQFHAK